MLGSACRWALCVAVAPSICLGDPGESEFLEVGKDVKNLAEVRGSTSVKAIRFAFDKAEDVLVLEHVGTFPNLESVALLRGRFDRSDLDQLATIPRLRTLTLASDEITYFPAGLRGHPRLEVVCVGVCIEGPVLRDCAELPSLRDLYIRGCEFIKDDDVAALERSRSLQSIKLSPHRLGTYFRDNVSTRCFRHLAKVRTLREIEAQHVHQDSPRDVAQLAALPELRRLDLEWSRNVSDRSFQSARCFPALETLNLSMTATTGTALTSRRFPSLKTLDLWDCPLSESGLEAVSGLQGLVELRLCCNGRPTPAGLAKLARLRELRHLELAFCRVDADVVRALAELPHLEHLGGVDPELCEILRRSGIVFSTVRDLDVSGSEFVDRDVGSIVRGFPQLTEISLRWSSLTDAGGRELAKLEDLATVNLSFSSGIGDDTLRTLCARPSVRHIIAYGTSASKACVEELRRRRPAVRLDWIPVPSPKRDALPNPGT